MPGLAALPASSLVAQAISPAISTFDAFRRGLLGALASWHLRPRLAGLVGGIQFKDKLAFAIAIRLALEPIVNRRERDVRLHELRRLFDQLLQLGARLI